MSELRPRLYRIEAGYFVAGFELSKVVGRTAPIIAYMRGWDIMKVDIFCRRKGWKLERVQDA